VIRKEAWPFYRTISGVRLCWELGESKGPKWKQRLTQRGCRSSDADDLVSFSGYQFPSELRGRCDVRRALKHHQSMPGRRPAISSIHESVLSKTFVRVVQTLCRGRGCACSRPDSNATRINADRNAQLYGQASETKTILKDIPRPPPEPPKTRFFKSPILSLGSVLGITKLLFGGK
jgi:hypothetical protein